MTADSLKDTACAVSAISVFRNLLDMAPMSSFLEYLSCDGDDRQKLYLYGKFVNSLAPYGCCFSDFLYKAVCEDENVYIKTAAKKQTPPDSLEKNVKAELELCSKLSEITPECLCKSISYDGYIPLFENHETDFAKIYADRIGGVEKYGYGIFASAVMFRVENGEIKPVRSADNISVDSFVGYEQQRQQVIDNTQALVEGRPAANVLLCGDAGTGKSSTVKAAANMFAKNGVRLIELRKDQLVDIPLVMGKIADNPLKFILFIDDLSFNKNDDNFSMLKAALEGSASSKAENAVIYATSNRRHIVKETFTDRNDDDVHRNDTVQELISLSDRFGLTVYFEKPPKQLYLEIIHELAYRHNVQCDRAELDRRAEAFALAKGSRSPRAAEQFIRSLM